MPAEFKKSNGELTRLKKLTAKIEEPPPILDKTLAQEIIVLRAQIVSTQESIKELLNRLNKCQRSCSWMILEEELERDSTEAIE